MLLAHNYYQQRGGEDVSFKAEVGLLRQHGHHVVCFTRHNNEIDTMRPSDVASKTLWNRAVAHEFKALLSGVQPDIVHLHNTFPLLSPAIAAAARRVGIPVVQTLHNFRMICAKAQLFREGHVCEECLGRSVAWPAFRHACYRDDRRATTVVVGLNLLQRALRSLAPDVDRFIVLTENARRHLIRGGLPAARLAVKPNFLLSDPGVGGGAGGYALYVGRLSPEKGVTTLLDAWASLAAPLQLKIAGDGPLATEVQHAAARDARIEPLGWCDHDNIMALLKGAAFVVAPSLWYEGLPHSIIESFAVGTPVITSRLGALAELVEDGTTGLHFTAGNAVDLAERIVWVLAHPIEYEAMREGARREYEQRYTASHNYDLLMNIYREVLDERNDLRAGRSCSVK